MFTSAHTQFLDFIFTANQREADFLSLPLRDCNLHRIRKSTSWRQNPMLVILVLAKCLSFSWRRGRRWVQLCKQPLTYPLQMRAIKFICVFLHFLPGLSSIIRYGFLTVTTLGPSLGSVAAVILSFSWQTALSCFCPCQIHVQSHCCSKHSSTTLPGGGPLCHHVCLNNKYQWINTWKTNHILLWTSEMLLLLFPSLSKPCQFFYTTGLISSHLIACTDKCFQLNQTSFRSAGHTYHLAGVMWIHWQNMALWLHCSQQKSHGSGNMWRLEASSSLIAAIFYTKVQSQFEFVQARNNFQPTIKLELLSLLFPSWRYATRFSLLFTTPPRIIFQKRCFGVWTMVVSTHRYRGELLYKVYC